VGPLLASGGSIRRFQEPPEAFVLRAALALSSLPAVKARLRRRLFAALPKNVSHLSHPGLDTDRSLTPIAREPLQIARTVAAGVTIRRWPS